MKPTSPLDSEGTYPSVEVHLQHELAQVGDWRVWYVYRDGRVG